MFSLTEAQKMCVGKRRTFKVGGFALQLDGMGWFLLAIAIIAIGLMAFPALRNMSKNSSQRVELTQLRDAVIEYQGIRIDGAAPANLDVLMANPCISAAQAVDGQAHGAILTRNDRWANGIVDVWGTAYTYTVNADGSGTITSTGSGTNMSIDF